jgi:hypothetical protein
VEEGPDVIDSDDAVTNYVFHPYWGAAYYIRARERGFGVLGSAVYSALLSTIFEFGVEAFFEQPSYQELIMSSIAGTLQDWRTVFVSVCDGGDSFWGALYDPGRRVTSRWSGPAAPAAQRQVVSRTST